MKFIRFTNGTATALGVLRDDEVVDLSAATNRTIPNLAALLANDPEALQWIDKLVQGAPAKAVHAYAAINPLVPLTFSEKIIGFGLDYAEHIKEAPIPQEVPTYPMVFLRTARTLIAQGDPILRPRCSEQLDFKDELACIIGKPARNVSRASALDQVGGYALFNDASIRDYQFKSHQSAMGKNFDTTCPFYPGVITADELPRGDVGPNLSARLNGQVVQSASTDDLIFDIATLTSEPSVALTLMPGDVILTGTSLRRGPGQDASTLDEAWRRVRNPRRCLRALDQTYSRRREYRGARIASARA